MKFRKYIGGVYQLYYEEINIKFLVHKDIIDEDTRDMILFYMMTGIVPEGIRVRSYDNVICFEPCTEQEDSYYVEQDVSKMNNPLSNKKQDFLWFAL